MQLLVRQFTNKMFHIRFMQILILQSLKSQYYKIFRTLKFSYLQLNRPESFCCYNSHEVAPCGSGVPRNFVRGGSTNTFEDRRQRERGSGGGSPLVRGSGGSCNLVQEISFHIVEFS